MAKPRHLDNPPITEGLLDFRAVLPSGFETAKFASLHSELAGQYPLKSEHAKIEARFLKGVMGKEADTDGLSRRVEALAQSALRLIRSLE